MTKRILVLTADAGFGHRAAANAVAAALEERYGDDCSVAIVNPMDDRRVPAMLRRAQNDYDRHMLDTPELYQFGYRASDGAFPGSVVEQALIAMLGRTMQKIIAAQQPDAIVSTYPLYQAPLAAVFAITKSYVPLLTVVTDLVDVHAIWFNDEVDRCLVATKQLQERALQYGLRRDCVEVTGLPVNPCFAHPADKQTLRAELGWNTDRVAVLCAGSVRVTRLEPVVYALNHSALPLELALVSGGSEALLDKWRHTKWHQPTHVYGYVPEMYKLIQAADLIVCKAGGVIISEALAAGLPLLLIEALAGWEDGNADFVVQSGAGEMAPDALAAQACIFHWLEGDRSLLATRAANARRAGHPYAAYRVAELAWQAAHEGSPRREHRFLAQVPLLKQLLQSSRSAGTKTRSKVKARGTPAPRQGRGTSDS
jgi:1,2-diacylglycerol 3-beta-galactosyltransferase